MICTHTCIHYRSPHVGRLVRLRIYYRDATIFAVGTGGGDTGAIAAKTDDAIVASHTTVTPIANITAFEPAVVKRQATPGNQLKFPTALGVVDGPAVPWFVTSYSDQAEDDRMTAEYEAEMEAEKNTAPKKKAATKQK